MDKVMEAGGGCDVIQVTVTNNERKKRSLAHAPATADIQQLACEPAGLLGG